MNILGYPRVTIRRACIPLVCLALVALPAASADGAANRIDVADYQTGGRTDAQAIQAAIDDAVAGDTVYFPGGVYRIDEPFFFGSGVNHVADAGSPAILTGTGATSLQLLHTGSNPLHGTTIRGLHFDNLEVRFSGASTYSTFTDVTFADCLFRNGRRATPWASDYLYLRYTLGVSVDGCTFLRNSASGGRGVVLERTRLTVIKDSFFGTTRDLEDGAPNGYFKTAINLTGYDTSDPRLRNEDVVVDGNVWRRRANIACPTGIHCEDHGMYAWGWKDVHILGNYGDGWSRTSSGGALKFRNGDNGFVIANHFATSGILTYNYPHANPAHLNRLRVDGNRIDIRGDDSSGQGIFYRRTNSQGSSSGSFCEEPGGEDDIYILNNRFVDGGTVDVRCAIGPEVCVEDNVGATVRLLTPGVRTNGCAVPESWDAPLAGIHRGDFNGDGRQDFVHRAAIGSGPFYWRAHLSAGDGYANQNWGDGVRVAAETERYGVHVGDFDGNGRDDIAYRGLCGSPSVACWRVHRSTGTGFMPPRDYGDLVYHSDETFRFGVHAGDFNGDGRDDLVLRGACGNGDPCWRVLSSQADATFAAADWGDGAYWDPVQTDVYGLLVGDYNGDGRDDIAYRGRCGASADCLRVHLSTTANTFIAQNWGDGIYIDGATTPHFGMRVGDRNGDGRADIAYRGRCGSSGTPQWRYHMGGSTGPFTLYCSPSYHF